MRFRQVKTLACVAAAGLAFACVSAAEVREVARIQIGPRQPGWSFAGLSGNFSQSKLAVTPAGDFLSFSARRDGPWELVRVRGWATKTPAIDHLSLPGYYTLKDRRDLETLGLNLFIVPDGRFAVCAASAWWNHRVHGVSQGKSRSETTLTVIDLATFQPVKSFKTTALDLFEFQGVTMDASGRIVVESRSSSALGSGQRGAFIQLDVPGLNPGPRCQYGLSYDANHKQRPVAEAKETCEANTRPDTLEEYLSQPNEEVRSTGFTCQDARNEYCPQPERFTPSGNFGYGVLSEGHDSFLGSWVEDRYKAIFFSAKTKAEVGALDTSRKSGFMVLASAAEKDYALWLENGSVLALYEISAPRASQPATSPGQSR